MVGLLMFFGIAMPPLLVVPLSIVIAWVTIEYFAVRADLRQTRIAADQAQTRAMEAEAAVPLFSAAQLSRRETMRQQVREALRSWRAHDPERHANAYALLRGQLQEPTAELDLRGQGLNSLPPCLGKLQTLSGIRMTCLVSPRLLYALRKTSGRSAPFDRPLDLHFVERRLSEWVGDGHGTPEDALFLRQKFIEDARLIDLTGRNLQTLPAVLATFPKLKTLKVSPRFLDVHARP
jgi:hypothetical protein